MSFDKSTRVTSRRSDNRVKCITAVSGLNHLHLCEQLGQVFQPPLIYHRYTINSELNNLPHFPKAAMDWVHSSFKHDQGKVRPSDSPDVSLGHLTHHSHLQGKDWP